MPDGEVQQSTVMYTTPGVVWEAVRRFPDIEDWMAITIDLCYVENAPCGPCDIGCIRRLVMRGSEMLLRERLSAHFSSPHRRYYTYDVLPYDEGEGGRSPFGTDFHDMRVTLTVGDITHQGKAFVEFYCTFGASTAEAVSRITQFYEGYFAQQLSCIASSVSAVQRGIVLPEALLRFHTEAAFKPHAEDLHCLEAMWVDAAASERDMRSRLETAEHELASTKAMLEAALQRSAALVPQAPPADAGGRGGGAVLCAACSAEVPSPCGGEAEGGVGDEVSDAGGCAALQRLHEDEAAGCGDNEISRSETPHWVPGTGGAVFPQCRSVPLRPEEIRDVFCKLDRLGCGFLTPQQVQDFYLSIDIFETPDTVSRILKRFITGDRVEFNSFHSLVLHHLQH